MKKLAFSSQILCKNRNYELTLIKPKNLSDKLLGTTRA